jgi:hypothetical protein
VIRAGWNRSTLYDDRGHTRSLGSDQKIHADKKCMTKRQQMSFHPTANTFSVSPTTACTKSVEEQKVTICRHSPFYCYGRVSYCTYTTLKPYSDRTALSQRETPQALRLSEAAVCS